jgi:CcmD family protein
MMRYKQKGFLLLVYLLSVTTVFGQTNQDFLRSTGKIYSVVIGIVIIFLGIVTYMWRLDKKMSELENRIKK